MYDFRDPRRRVNFDTRGQGGALSFPRGRFQEPEQPRVQQVEVVDVTPGNTLADQVGLPRTQVGQPVDANYTPVVTPSYDDYLSELAALGAIGLGVGTTLSVQQAQKQQDAERQLGLGATTSYSFPMVM